MNRRHIAFECGGEALCGTIDEADGVAGLLIITGGNEVRAGAFNGQARIAAEIAQAGFPVFRFDRRGVGDSAGENGGFRSSEADIRAALAAFRKRCPDLQSIVGFGNCDAASGLMLAQGAGCDALVLANPWTFDDHDGDAAPPPNAIRARYAQRLRNPREWLRLLRGGVDLRKLAGGLLAATKSTPPASTLASEIEQGLGGFAGPVRIVLAMRDRTAQAFAANWPADDRVSRRAEADHAFSAPADQAWLNDQLLAALHEQAGQLDMR